MLLVSVVAALALLPGAAEPGPVCAEDEPIAAIALSGGFRASGGVLVAVWDNGRMLRALDPKHPDRGYATGVLSPAVMREVRATLLRMRYWTWTQPRVGTDLKGQWTMACVEGRRASFRHSGTPSRVTGPGQLRGYLLGVRLPSPVRADGPPEVWPRWFRIEEPGF